MFQIQWFKIARTVCAVAIICLGLAMFHSVSAQVPTRSSGAHQAADGKIYLTLPPFTSAKQVHENSEFEDSAVAEILRKTPCIGVTELNSKVRATIDYKSFVSVTGKNIADCAVSRNYQGATRSVELVAPVDVTTWKHRTRADLAVNTSPYWKGGNGGNLDELARQAKEKIYQDAIRGNTDLAPEQSELLITMLQNKQCPVMTLPSGSYIAANYGVKVIPGRNRVYDQKPGDKPVVVAMCLLPDGAIIYIGEFCSNVYFPLQSAVYEITPPKKEVAAVVAPTPCNCAPVDTMASISVVKMVRNRTKDQNGEFEVSTKARRGQFVEYNIRVTNIGPTVARDVILLDSLPSGINSVTSGKPVQQYRIGTLRPGATADIRMSARVDSAPAQLINTATAFGSNTNTAREYATVFATKSSSPLPWIIGGAVGACAITYFVHVPPCGKKKAAPAVKPVDGPITRFSMTSDFGEPQGPPMFLQPRNAPDQRQIASGLGKQLSKLPPIEVTLYTVRF